MTSATRRTILVTLLVALLATTGIFAQATRGSLTGTVTLQSDGTGLAGAAVTAVHEPTGTRYSAITRADGRFGIQNVRVGSPYSVTVEAQSFQTKKVEGVTVALGEATDLDIPMQLESVEEVITVTAEANPIINPYVTGAQSNVSTEAIETLPTINRGLEDFARTNPVFAIVPDEDGADTIAVGGRNARYNAIQIDGAVNNDVFGLADNAQPGGQAGTNPISLDAIAEIQLVVAPFDVRQGGFATGGINAVTRSGTNDFKGSIFVFQRDDSLVGEPDDLGELGEFSEEQYGFRIGGPIVRDKMFFFFNGEINRNEIPSGWSIDGSGGGQVFGAAAAAQRFADIMQNQYGYDIGGFAQQTRPRDNDKFFLRGDFNLNDSNQLTVRHNYVDADNLINFPGDFTYEFPSEGYNFTNETNSTVAQLNSVLGTEMFNEARLNFTTIKDRRSGDDRFPWVEIEDIDPANGDFREFEAGTEPFSTRNELDQDIFEFTNDFTWIKGNHNLTIGTHNEFYSIRNLFVQNAFGAYEFRNLDDFEAGLAREYEYTIIPDGRADDEFDVQQIGFYVGDQWFVTPSLTLTYGLRVDIPFLPDEPGYNPDVEEQLGFRTNEIPDGNELFQPRIGFNWDVKGDGSSQLRGGVGIFAGRAPYVWISNNYARNGLEQFFVRSTAGNIPFNPDPDNQPDTVPGASATAGELNLIDPDFEFPNVLRYSLGYDTELPWGGLVASVEAIYTDTQSEIRYTDAVLEPTGQTGLGGRPLFRFRDTDFNNAFVLTTTDKGETTNFTLKLERPWRDGLFWFVSYAYGDSEVVNDGTSSRAISNFQFTEAINPLDPETSRSDFEVEHRFNAGVSYRFAYLDGWATTVSAFFNRQSGRPYSYIYGNNFFPSINGDGQGGNDLFYVPNNADEVIIQNGTFADLDAAINADPCLASHRGEIVPRNECNGLYSDSLDVRFLQDIPIGGTSFQISLDIENFLNLFDDDAGRVQYVGFAAVGNLVDFQGYDSATGKPIYRLDTVAFENTADNKFSTDNLRSRWRAKLGLRFSF